MRERRQAEKRRGARIRLGAWAVLALALVAGAVFLYRSSAFAIERVEVEGAVRLTERQVVDIAKVPEDSTLLRFPADRVRKRLEAHPWVAGVRVTRDFPDGMRIVVTERRPAALLDLGEDFWMVDAEGFVLERKALEESSTLVVVRDIEGVKPEVGKRAASQTLANALDVLEGISDELRDRVRAVRAPLIDETALLTTDGIEILMGEARELGKKDVVARRILEEQEGRVVFIDVRTVERPVWRGLGN